MSVLPARSHSQGVKYQGFAIGVQYRAPVSIGISIRRDSYELNGDLLQSARIMNSNILWRFRPRVVVKIDADSMNEVEQDCSDWMNLEVMGWWKVTSVCAEY